MPRTVFIPNQGRVGVLVARAKQTNPLLSWSSLHQPRAYFILQNHIYQYTV
jgi:hypothetical protein